MGAQETYQRTAAEFLLEVNEEGAQVADSWESMLPLHYAVQNRVRHPNASLWLRYVRLGASRRQASVGPALHRQSIPSRRVFS